MKVQLLATALVTAAAIALPVQRAAAQAATKDTAYHPRNVKEAASNTGHEAKRVFKRSKKTVGKAAVDTKNAVTGAASSVKHAVTGKPKAAAKTDSTAH